MHRSDDARVTAMIPAHTLSSGTPAARASEREVDTLS
jgi:hypothetical protein